MITLRKAEERGHADHGWLRTFHTFSFASYHDPKHMKFHTLRVINEDWIAGGQGFPSHPHDNMEIITYIISGALEHRDNQGNGSVLRRGELQRMSAGTGITHSEYNPEEEEAHLLQIWIRPDQKELPPEYEQRAFPMEGPWSLLASKEGREESLKVHQDLDLHRGLFKAGETVDLLIDEGRCLWLQMIAGSLTINGVTVGAGDGAAVEQEADIRISADTESEFLLFNLAAA